MPQLLPGFGGAPAPPPPPPPPPTREDPAIAEAKERQRLAEKRRRGRRATFFTGDQSGLGDSTVSRPQARQGQLLGN